MLRHTVCVLLRHTVCDPLLSAFARRHRGRVVPILCGLLGAITAAGVLAATGHGVATAEAAQPGMTVWSRVYSTAQSARGEQAYKSACGYCHKDDLIGGFMDDGVGRAPALAGPQAFGSSLVERWKDQTLGEMVYVIASTMPRQAPTSLRLDTYVDILTYLLERNGIPAGTDELPADIPTLRDITITAPR